jgi:hypothetical protein
MPSEPKYEEQFTAFIDSLGFSEVSTGADDTSRLKVLDLLLSLSALRGEFDAQSTTREAGKTSHIKPAISTFSDHIVMSYPLQPIYTEMGLGEQAGAFFIVTHFMRLLASIAAAALRIGFLVRGGATIGKLYHARGVVFGEALVEAFQIESHTSIYPRVVLSPQITSRPIWIDKQQEIAKGDDGLYHLDYFKTMLLDAALPGSSYGAALKAWFEVVVALIAGNLNEFESGGRLNELAKWAWFAREFRSGLERMNPELLRALNISLDAVSWTY